MAFNWPSRPQFKEWLGYTELTYSAANPKIVFEKISESLEDLGYKVEEKPFSLHKTGDWEEVADLEAKIHATKLEVQRKPLVKLSKQNYNLVVPAGVVGVASAAYGFGMEVWWAQWVGLALIAAFVLVQWANTKKLSREISVVMTGEARKGMRARKVKDKTAQGGDKALHESYLTSELDIRVGGRGNYPELDGKVREDVKLVVAKISGLLE